MKNLKLNAFLNSVKTLMTVIFPLITVPYLSRVLGKASYGKVNFSISIVSYFVIIAGFGFSAYAIREGSRVRKDRHKFTQFANEIFTLNIGSTIISYIALLALLMLYRKMDEYRILISILSINIIFITLGADWVNSVYEDYVYITIRYISVQILSIILMVVFVHSAEDLVIYTCIHLLSQIGANVLNIFHIRKYVHLGITFHNLRRHIIPVFVLFVTTLATTIYVNSDITILGIIRGDEEVGIYSVASRVYSVVKQITVASTIVTIPRLSAYLGANDPKSYNRLLSKVINMLFSIAIPIFVGLFMQSKNTLEVIGGHEYIAGTNALQILCGASIFSVIAFFFAQCILIPNKREIYFLRATIVSALLNAVLNFIIIPYLGNAGAALTTLIAEIAVMIICIHYSRGFHDLSISKVTIRSTLLSCALIVVVCVITNEYIHNPFLCVLIAVIFSGAGYLGIMMLFKNESIMGLLPARFRCK